MRLSRPLTSMGSILALAPALLALAGCNPEDTQNLSRDLRSTASHTGVALGNAKLAGSVNTVLALRKGVSMKGLHIEAKDGVVTVGGWVRDAAERRRVIETVNNTRGVQKVVNKLRIQRE